VIKVVNRHHHPKHRYTDQPDLENYTYIGRPHPLSNPFKLNADKSNREEVVVRFGKEVLRPALQRKSGGVWDSLLAIAQLHADGKTVHLGCSCKRKKPEDREGYEDLACHADAVAIAVEWIVEKRYVHPVSDAVSDEVPTALSIGDRVCHANPLIADRTINQDSPRRLGIVAMTADSHPWDCVMGMVGVEWTDWGDIHTVSTSSLRYVQGFAMGGQHGSA
jgi:hypothetical protein